MKTHIKIAALFLVLLTSFMILIPAPLQEATPSWQARNDLSIIFKAPVRGQTRFMRRYYRV